MYVRLFAFLGGLLAIASPSPALGWGHLGHRIICEIAFQELEPPARERVKALVRQDPEFDTFAAACIWPDWPRRRAAEHFVNLRRDAAGFAGVPCPTAGECVVSAIEKDLAVLSSTGASAQERVEALKYLGHWVGDVHQPLHVSFQDDRGGNGISVSGGVCRSDLHVVWDTCFVEHALDGSWQSLARDLRAEVTEADRAAWLASRPIDWAEESYRITISPKTGYCVRTGTSCWYDASREQLAPGELKRTVEVDEAYIEMHAPIVRERLVKAGVRLGGLLNVALGK